MNQLVLSAIFEFGRAIPGTRQKLKCMKRILTVMMMACFAVPSFWSLSAQEWQVQESSYDTNDSVPLDIFFVLNNRSNISILKTIRESGSNKPAVMYLSANQVSQPENLLDISQLTIDKLWNATPGIPENCKRVIFGTPVLVNPNTGIVFGFIKDKTNMCFRLPKDLIKKYTVAPKVATRSLPTTRVINDNWLVKSTGKNHNDLIYRSYEYSFRME